MDFKSAFDRDIHFTAAALTVLLAAACSSSSDLEHPNDPNRTLAMEARAILPPKSEIEFPPIPFTRLQHAIHRASPIAGYERIFGDRTLTKSSCRIVCIGGDCEAGPNSEAQLFLVQGKFVVSYSRTIPRTNRIIAYLISLKRSFIAPIVFLDCPLIPTSGGNVTADDLLAQLPPGTVIDSRKNATLTLQESLPSGIRVFELGTNRCQKKPGNPYSKVALFALTSNGITTYSSSGRELDYKIQCHGPKGSSCGKISDFLESNGVSGCLY